MGARCELRSLVPRSTIVHIHGMWSPLLWRSANLARNFRVPYAITPHGMLDPWCLRQKSLKKRVALAVGWRRILDARCFPARAECGRGPALGNHFA